MQASYLSQIKQELRNKNSKELLEICLRLARFKKENKELLTYLLFEADDEQAYIESIKNYMDHEFSGINKSNIYFAKKNIRKILKNTNKFIRYSGHKQTEVELLIYFCRCLKKSGLPLNRSVALNNLYQRQIEKIKKSMKSLHEDLQFDYGEELNQIL
jgi:hypothetical protein